MQETYVQDIYAEISEMLQCDFAGSIKTPVLRTLPRPIPIPLGQIPPIFPCRISWVNLTQKQGRPLRFAVGECGEAARLCSAVLSCESVQC